MSKQRKRRIRPEIKLIGYTAILAVTFIAGHDIGTQKSAPVQIPAQIEQVQACNMSVLADKLTVQVLGASTVTPYYDIDLTAEEQDIVREEAEAYGVPFKLALAVIEVESSYNASARNGKAWGAMQVHEVNHDFLEKKLGITDWLDLRQNVRAGCYMLGSLLEKYEDEDKALMAYNLGENGAREKWAQGIYSTKYVEKVKTALSELKTVLAKEI